MTRTNNKIYNQIAQGYTKATLRPLRKYVYNFTVASYLGDLHGKDVLDLGCGEGVSTRIIKRLGARKVVGIDSSDVLIGFAKNKRMKGLYYYVGDVFHQLKNNAEKFDIVTGIMIIHYASSKKMLKQFLDNIKKNIKLNGRVYLLTLNPRLFKEGYEKYGVRISKAKKEGDSVRVELHNFKWDKYCEFKNYYWTKETYKALFKEKGFSIRFLPSLIQPDGLKKYGKVFWCDFNRRPIYLMIEAINKNS